MNARKRRRDEARLARNRAAVEVTSYPGAPIEVVCANGHPEMRSRTRYDDKGRVSSVLWTCGHEGCDARVEVDPKKRRDDA